MELGKEIESLTRTDATVYPDDRHAKVAERGVDLANVVARSGSPGIVKTNFGNNR